MNQRMSKEIDISIGAYVGWKKIYFESYESWPLEPYRVGAQWESWTVPHCPLEPVDFETSLFSI